jgi:uncharacterized protein YdaU (DUF1376 family)
MHYYQFNVADYRKSTQYLSFLEHAIYRTLIDTYYLDESPLCGDDAKLMRLHSIRTEEEIEAFKVVIEDFFTLKDDGYHHEKCDEVLSKIYAKSEKARASANKRWERNANASETQGERNANGMLPNTYIPNNPIPNKNNTPVEPSKDSVESVNQIFMDAGITKDQVSEIRSIRKANKGGKITDRVAKTLVKQFTLAGSDGWTLDQMLDKWSSRSWKSFEADWMKSKTNGNSYQTAQQQRAESAARTFDPEVNRQMLEGL